MVVCPCPFPAAPSPKSIQRIPGDGALLQLQSSQLTQCLVSPLWLPVGAGSLRRRGARRDDTHTLHANKQGYSLG